MWGEVTGKSRRRWRKDRPLNLCDEMKTTRRRRRGGALIFFYFNNPAEPSNMAASFMAPPSPTLPQSAVHPVVQPLSYLLGSWKGNGEGSFPTISSFRYSEELQFSHSPNKPVIAYSSKTWKLGSGEPMHAESGFWRPKPDGTIEVVIAQSTGLVEVQKGTYDAEQGTIKLKCCLVGNATKVKEITRVFEMVDGELSYEVEMATNRTSLQTHLKASLKKL